MERSLIDANVFLELELAQSRAPECKAFLTAVAKGELEAAVTEFTVDRVALVMESRGSPPADVRKFFDSLKGYKGLSITGLSLGVRVAATGEMESKGLDYDDAISVATMKSLGMERLVSFDRDFDGIEGIRRLDPADAVPREGGSGATPVSKLKSAKR